MKIPGFILRKLYVPGSLRAEAGGVRFALRNTLATATLTGMKGLRIDQRDVPPEVVRLRIAGAAVDVGKVSVASPVMFPRNEEAEVLVAGPLAPGAHRVRLEALSAEFGELVIEFEDHLGA